MASKDALCSFKFQAVPNFFVDYTEMVRQSPSFRATTLPGLGLTEQNYDTDGTAKANHSPGNDKKHWERFRDYIEYLNGQTPASTMYKVLYITRHGLGYHNVFESEVGRDMWNVGNHF